ncbi:MAG: hypothetical protein ACP5RM_03165 [Candidatus Micrarchaeia archaeon]
MKAHSWNVLIALGMIAIFSFAVFGIEVFATSSGNVVANVQVGNVIYLSVSPSKIYFTGLAPGSTMTTNALNVVTDNDIGGNIAANILVEGTNLVNVSNGNSILVGNTVWSATAGSTGISLTSTFVNTNIFIPQPTLSIPSTGNFIYFGVNIPGGTPPGNYVQTISFENENTTQLKYNQSSSSNTVTLVANVVGTCYISLSTNSISFGNVYASANVPTNVLVTDYDNNGNVAATLMVSGTNWQGATTTFGVSNTLWSAASQSSYTGNALTSTLTSTGITVPAPTQSSPTQSAPIYFGLAVPPGTPGGSYTQTITIENSC